jgi:hypothetical protein
MRVVCRRGSRRASGRAGATPRHSPGRHDLEAAHAAEVTDLTRRRRPRRIVLVSAGDPWFPQRVRPRALVAAAAALACAHAASPRAPGPDAVAAERSARSSAPLSDEQLRSMCAARLPECRHPYAALARPHPCEHRGARCTEPLLPAEDDWGCSCDACASEAECALGAHCAEGWRGCPPRRVPRVCAPGEAPPPAECPPETLLDPPLAVSP